MNTEQLRAEFEAWYVETYGIRPTRDGLDPTRYFANPTQARWEGYQAGRAALKSPEIQSLRKSLEIKNEALMSAQQQISGMRPDGSSDPESPQWHADAALWDYYQDAINDTKEQQT